MNAERVSAEALAKADMLRRVPPKNVKMPRRQAVELHALSKWSPAEKTLPYFLVFSSAADSYFTLSEI
jgi:hypothetical protein